MITLKKQNKTSLWKPNTLSFCHSRVSWMETHSCCAVLLLMEMLSHLTLPSNPRKGSGPSMVPHTPSLTGLAPSPPLGLKVVSMPGSGSLEPSRAQ